MGSPRRPLRVFATLWAVLQFALPMATLYADAFDARASSGRYASHIEDAASSACRPVHTEECALCRFLSNSSAPLARAAFVPVAQRAMVAPVSAGRAVCLTPARGIPASRAPPVG